MNKTNSMVEDFEWGFLTFHDRIMSLQKIYEIQWNLSEESGYDIADVALDCIHRVGKSNSFRKNVGLVNARFTTFRHGTSFWNMESLSKNRLHLDLTKVRFVLYQEAIDWVKAKKSVKYVCIDVNCWLKINVRTNKKSFFHLLVN